MTRINVHKFAGLLLLIGTLFAGASKAEGQLSSEAAASVITVYPGEQLYSAFGHTAIRISDPARSLDRLYNYGTFDFDGPGFYLKFIRGRLDYRLSVAPAAPLLEHYRRLGRSTVEQALSLEPAEVDSLYRFLETNYRPENRYYRYDFFFDNCSTRPRDALEAALDSIAYDIPQDRRLLTFREHLDPYLNDRPVIHLGIDLVLGQPTDQTATPYEAMFLPVELQEALERADVISGGEPRPLVVRTDTLYWNESNISPAAGLPWVSLLLWVGCAAALGRTWYEFRSPGQMPGWMYRIDAAVYIVIGLIGLIITLLAVATEHAVVDPNWNLLWAWPTHLAAAFLLWQMRNPPALRIYLAVSSLASLVTLAGWYWWPQQIPPAVIPVLLWQVARGARHAIRYGTFRESMSVLRANRSGVK